MNYEVLATSATTVIAAGIAAYQAIKLKKLEVQVKENTVEHAEVNIKLTAMDKLMEFSAFNNIKNISDEIFDKTSADKIMIMSAVNGKTDLKRVTALYEHREDNDPRFRINALNQYNNMVVDSEHRNLLKRIELDGSVELSRSAMRESDLKYVYESDNITASKLIFIGRYSIDETNDLLLYGSVSTKNGEYNDTDRIYIKTYFSSIINNINLILENDK